MWRNTKSKQGPERPLSYADWDTNSMFDVKSGKQCFIMYPQSPIASTRWRSVDCDNRHLASTYVCEKRIRDLTATGAHDMYPPLVKYQPVTNVRCPPMFTYLKDKCILLLTTNKPNDQHETTCISRGGIGILNYQTVPIESLLYLLKVWRHMPEYGSLRVNNDHGNCHQIDVIDNGIWVQYEHNIVDTCKINLQHVLCETKPFIQDRCQEMHFQCVSGECILHTRLCDQQEDCIDGSDEINCDYNCTEVIAGVFSGICVSNCGLLRFACLENEACLEWGKVCDGEKHCPQGEDEAYCYLSIDNNRENEEHYRCINGQTIHTTYACNGRNDCIDGSDELYCDTCSKILHEKCDFIDTNCHIKKSRCMLIYHTYKLLELPNYQACAKFREDFSPCSKHSYACYPREHVCLYNPDNYDEGMYCSDILEIGTVVDCSDYQCPGYFKCRNDFCIHLQLVCDGKWDCRAGDDELHCSDRSYCVHGSLWCEDRCISQDLICDGRKDCKNGDDELMCTMVKCPHQCTCVGTAISCIRTFLVEIPNIDKHTKAIFFSGNRLLVDYYHFRNFRTLFVLDISLNRIDRIPSKYFFDMISVVVLSLRGNDIRRIAGNTFMGLSNVRMLDVRDNILVVLEECAFCGMESLTTIDLSGQHITFIEDRAFQFTSIEMLNLSYNKITDLNKNVFEFAFYLTTIDLRFNRLHNIHKDAFMKINRPYDLYTDDYKYCCMARNAHYCTPGPDTYSTCEDLMAGTSLRVGVWVLSLVTIVLNVGVLMYRHKQTTSTPLSFLIQHLGVSDMLMGFYLLIIASADAYYRSVYAVYDDHWRASVMCKLAGFVSMLSSEMSMFLLVLITGDRVAVLGLRRDGLNAPRVRIVVLIGWIICAMVSLFPILDLSYFGNGSTNPDGSPTTYIKHGICFLFNFTDGKIQGWEYATFIFIICNMVALSFIVVGYSYTLMTILRQAGCSGGEELRVASKIACVVGSDCLCWIPPLIIGILSLVGIDINPNIVKWVAVFVFPINSALNPILYTFTDTSCKNVDETQPESMSSGDFARILETMGYIETPKHCPQQNTSGPSGVVRRIARISRKTEPATPEHPFQADVHLDSSMTETQGHVHLNDENIPCFDNAPDAPSAEESVEMKEKQKMGGECSESVRNDKIAVYVDTAL